MCFSDTVAIYECSTLWGRNDHIPYKKAKCIVMGATCVCIMKISLHQAPALIDGILNSIKVVDHTKIIFVKVVKNWFLFR